MTAVVRIERAQPSDAGAIASLLAGSLDASFAQLVPYGCSGAAEFIAMQIGVCPSVADSVYLVAREQGVVIGMAELRHTSDGPFLNNIAVHQRHRGRGTGAALLAAGLALFESNSGHIGLDSLEGNDRAEGWYRRLGFVRKHCTEFAEVSPPLQEADALLRVSGLPQAELAQQQFGFSSFTVHTAVPVSVGRIGRSWFRLSDPGAVRDPAVFATLRAFDPDRRFLAVLPVPAMPAEQRIRVLARLHRMEADIAQVLAGLAEQKTGTEPRLAAVSS